MFKAGPVILSPPENYKGGSVRRLRKTLVIAVLVLPLCAGPSLADGKAASKDGSKTGNHPAAPTLDDLGFSPDEIKSDPQYQKELQTRSDMLQIHQTLGLLTAVPLTTEYVLGFVTAGNVANGSTNTGLHAVLGASTTALYATTALFAILAPKPKGLKPSGNTQTHVDLAWVHAPLMVAVPVLGGIVNSRVQDHQSLGDLGTIHGILATALVASYLASLTVMTF